jgi:hypothetical protein
LPTETKSQEKGNNAMSLELNYGFVAPKKATKKSKARMGTFEASLTTIYSRTETNKLESIFEQKKEEFYASRTYDYNEVVRYKEMEILRVIRKELGKRNIEVEILR